MQERIELIVVEDKRRTGAIGLAVAASAVLHGLLIVWFIRSYQPAQQAADTTPITRYVELLRQNPSEFVEAPGQKIDTAPLNAPLSDANRKASTPEPTGDKPTTRPGDGTGLYQPKPNPLPRGPRPTEAAPQMAQAQPQQSPATEPGSGESPATKVDADQLVYRQTTKASAAAGAGINWNSAIKEVGKIASLGGGDGLDLGPITGGEKGTAEAGPLSFETKWYDWGEYAQSMVSRIRVNWYANMPPIIRTGMQGVVTIRFTIQRDGRITDLTILDSSTVPPYDFAAKKAIELSSPLNPLPKDFPNPSERVTAMFYYNKRIE